MLEVSCYVEAILWASTSWIPFFIFEQPIVASITLMMPNSTHLHSIMSIVLEHIRFHGLNNFFLIISSSSVNNIDGYLLWLWRVCMCKVKYTRISIDSLKYTRKIQIFIMANFKKFNFSSFAMTLRGEGG